MGFGHRVYKTYDPRARALGKVAEQLGGEDERFALARHVEETAIRLLEEYKPGRRCTPTSSTTRPPSSAAWTCRPACTPATFAAARTAGWTAHILEQLANNRLIRPTVDYVGPMPEGYGSYLRRLRGCRPCTTRSSRGGVSGIAAAVQLHAAGADVVLLEARGRLGGRVATAAVGGVAVERGGEFLDAARDGALLPLLERLGVATAPASQDGAGHRTARSASDSSTSAASGATAGTCASRPSIRSPRSSATSTTSRPASILFTVGAGRCRRPRRDVAGRSAGRARRRSRGAGRRRGAPGHRRLDRADRRDVAPGNGGEAGAPRPARRPPLAPARRRGHGARRGGALRARRPRAIARSGDGVARHRGRRRGRDSRRGAIARSDGDRRAAGDGVGALAVQPLLDSARLEALATVRMGHVVKAHVTFDRPWWRELADAPLPAATDTACGHVYEARVRRRARPSRASQAPRRPTGSTGSRPRRGQAPCCAPWKPCSGRSRSARGRCDWTPGEAPLDGRLYPCTAGRADPLPRRARPPGRPDSPRRSRGLVDAELHRRRCGGRRPGRGGGARRRRLSYGILNGRRLTTDTRPMASVSATASS